MTNISNYDLENNLGESATIDKLVHKHLEKIKEGPHGTFKLDKLGKEDIAALRIIARMHDWQQEHNKGVKILGRSKWVSITNLQEIERIEKEGLNL